MKTLFRYLFIIRCFLCLMCFYMPICLALSEKIVPLIADTTTFTVKSISIYNKPIFDITIPAENNSLFRLVNRIQVKTKKSVLSADLFFKEGDVINNRLLLSSERLLNTRRYLKKPMIKIDAIDAMGNADIGVYVQNVWTLQPQLSFSRSGGSNKSSYGISDANFLGSGREITIQRSSNRKRVSNSFSFKDNNIFQKASIELSYLTSSDGTGISVRLNKKFLELQTPWASGINYEQNSLQQTLYSQSAVYSTFNHSYQHTELFYGWKLEQHSSINSNTVSRVKLGISSLIDEFSKLPTQIAKSQFETRDFKFIWLEYERNKDGYIKVSNINQINRNEYINLAPNWSVRLGYSSPAWGAKREAFSIDSSFSYGYQFDNHLLLYHSSFNGYLSSGKLYNSILDSNISWYWRNFYRGLIAIEASATRGFDLFIEKPLEIGGLSGLRGYKASYQSGDRKALLTMEQRYYIEKEFFSLLHIGSAVFFDVGRVWGNNHTPQPHSGWLQNVGVGLRLASTRSGNKDKGTHVVHIDLVYPLAKSGMSSDFQFRLKVQNSF